MEWNGNPNRVEAMRLLRVAEKLLKGKHFNRSRKFAISAQQMDPFLEGTEKMLAVADVLLAAEKRLNNHHDWYAILQLDRGSQDLDLIKKQYRRLAFLLHPDKNSFAFADDAFRLVADACVMLSEAVQQRHQFRREQEETQPQPETQPQKIPVNRRSSAVDAGGSGGEGEEDTRPPNFWTMCPYCYNLYEYPCAYKDCCLRCQNCERAFHAAAIPSLPPVVPGKEEYYGCWGFFPLRFVNGGATAGFVEVSEETNATPAGKKRSRKNVQPA